MKKRILLFCLSLCLLLSAYGCKQPVTSTSSSEPISEDPNFPVTVRGETITEAPTKLVSLSPALTQILLDMGYADLLVGVSDFCAPGDLTEIPRCGTFQAIDFDTLAQLKPDYLLSQTRLSDGDMNRLLQLDIDLILIERASDARSLKQIYLDLARMIDGAVFGENYGTDFVEDRFGVLDALQTAVKAYVAEHGKQTFLYLKTPDYTVATGDSFESSILESLGLTNLAKGYGNWEIPKADAEQLAPAIVFYDNTLTQEQLDASEIYGNLDAVFVPIDVSAFEKQGSALFYEIADTVEQALPDAFVVPVQPQTSESTSISTAETASQSSSGTAV